MDEGEETGILVDGVSKDLKDKTLLVDKLKAALIQAKRNTEKCEHELAREREISNQLMSTNTTLDLLTQDIATLKSEKEKLVTNVTELHVENSRLKTYVTFLSGKIYNLQTDLTRADEEKDNSRLKAEKERQQIQDKKQDQLDLITEKDQLIKELNIRISLLEKENKEAAIESEKKLREAEKENATLRKELTLIGQKIQKQANDQTVLKKANKGTILSGGDNRYQMCSLKTGECTTRLDGVEGVTCIELVSDELLATSSSDLSINLWNWKRGELVNSFVGHTGLVVSIARLSDKSLVSGSKDAEIRMWDIDSGKCLRTHKYSFG